MKQATKKDWKEYWFNVKSKPMKLQTPQVPQQHVTHVSVVPQHVKINMGLSDYIWELFKFSIAALIVGVILGGIAWFIMLVIILLNLF